MAKTTENQEKKAQMKPETVLRMAKIGGYRRDDVLQYIDELLTQQADIVREYELKQTELENQLVQFRSRQEETTQKGKEIENLKKKLSSGKDERKEADKKLKKLKEKNKTLKNEKDFLTAENKRLTAALSAETELPPAVETTAETTAE